MSVLDRSAQRFTLRELERLSGCVVEMTTKALQRSFGSDHELGIERLHSKQLRRACPWSDWQDVFVATVDLTDADRDSVTTYVQHTSCRDPSGAMGTAVSLDVQFRMTRAS